MRGPGIDEGGDVEHAEVALRSVLAVLRSSELTDRSARIKAEQVAVDALIALDERRPVRNDGLEPAVEAFERLRSELRTLTRYGSLAIDFVQPPANGRAVPTAIAESARSCVRVALLAQMDEQSATRARVQWDCDGTNLLVDVHDNGHGTASREDDRFRPIAQRVEQLHGDWTVEATPGWGGHLHLRFPLDGADPAAAQDSIGAELTDRQNQIRTLIAQGRTNREIADELAISTNTVKYHVSAMMRVVAVRRRAQLVAGTGDGARP
ncbi:LuxR C-terminal-related transcriptional regulator [Cellulosimicrobium sp. NPDC057127]|uniref:helix-turn-helix transcriptional regulator n=1 Tax=Cellulosimicrobium sp. NPDC057127 TaxID=3346026 RepID=UPI00363FB34A